MLRPRRRWRTGRFGSGRESGMSMIELMVTVALLMVVTGVLLGSVDNLTATESNAQSRTNNQDEIRQVIYEMAKDVRASNPMVALGGDSNGYATDYANRMQIAQGPAQGTQTWVEWKYAGGVITRSNMSGPNGNVLSSGTKLRGMSNNASTPLFRYYRSATTEMDPAATLAYDIANCTIRVVITIQAAPTGRGVPVAVTQSVELRNRVPGGLGC
jgi:Tfp pilus assembly protein PilV